MYACPDQIPSPSQVPGLAYGSRKRKRAQRLGPDSNCSDDDAVNEILLQRKARHERHEQELQFEEEEEEGNEERGIQASSVPPLVKVRTPIDSNDLADDYFEDTAAHDAPRREGLTSSHPVTSTTSHPSTAASHIATRTNPQPSTQSDQLPRRKGPPRARAIRR